MIGSHTRGPWKTGRNLHGFKSVYSGPSIYADGYMIAETLGGLEEQVQANARLIAAAPETAAERDRLKVINAELLEAAYKITDLIFKDAICKGENHANIALEEPEVKALQAAIVKARGGAA